ncbi:hypothetical protein Tco_0089981 [Tanacetum coccineum]
MVRKQLGLTRSWFSATIVHKRVTLLGSAEQKLVKTAKGTQHKDLECRKEGRDSQALISVDTFINWQDHEDAHDEGALKIYGMIVGMESDLNSERKATSEYAMICLLGFTKTRGTNFVSTIESASETVVESEPMVVMSNVWTDAPL